MHGRSPLFRLRAGKAGGGHDLERDVPGLLGADGAEVAGQAAAVQGDVLGQRQRDDDVVEVLIAVGGIEAEGEVERLPCGDAVAVAGGAHEQVGRGRLVLVHALAQRDAELLQRLGGVQIGQVDGQRVAAAVVDDVAEQNDVAVIIILRVRRNLLRRGRAVADVLQAGGVGVVVAVEQLADLAGAGVGEHGGIDARGDLLRLDAVPRRGMVHDLEHDVDLITDLHGGDLAARGVGDGVGGDVDAVGAGRVNGRRRRGGGVGDIQCGDVVCHNRRTQRRRQSKGGQQGK